MAQAGLGAHLDEGALPGEAGEIGGRFGRGQWPP